VIEVSDRDLSALDAAVADVTSGDFLRGLAADTSSGLLKAYVDTWPEERTRQAKKVHDFEKRIEVVWGGAISYLALMTTLAREVGKLTVTRLRESDELSGRVHLLEALSRLHARACRNGLEIEALLRSGFADAGLARWRSMYEAAVVAMTLHAKGEATAERYLLHEVVETLKIARLNQKYEARLGLAPTEDDLVGRLEQRVRELKERFGTAFAQPYGWAATNPGQHLRDFASLEQQLDMGHWRPYYKLASHGVHANAKGLMFSVGVHPERDVLLTGRSNLGLEVAGQNAAISLLQVTSALISLDPTLDSIVFSQVLVGLTDRTIDAFVRAHAELTRQTHRGSCDS
jgi:hypothetical protein